MRVKPDPGTYHVHIENVTYVVVITTDGLEFAFWPFQFIWRWEEIAGGPHLVGDNAFAAAIGPAGFTDPDVIVVRTPAGAVSGTYDRQP